ncbi:unnamed protein product [Amoebophrya sp. A25]|nr:unnamed protein product [Amoebophrya sp. A25]|eukprot:GSA25T00016512001.1
MTLQMSSSISSSSSRRPIWHPRSKSVVVLAAAYSWAAKGVSRSMETMTFPGSDADFDAEISQIEKKVDITEEESQWLEIMAQGWTSKNVTGFMREDMYLNSLHKQDPPVPIVLSCDLPLGWEAGTGKLALFYKGQGVAILNDVEVFEHRKEERIARTFGLVHPEYPYIKTWIEPAHNSLCGGDLSVAPRAVSPQQSDGLDEFRLAPTQIRAQLEGHDAVFVFQLRNPIHNGHALLMKDTHRQLLAKGFKKPLLWINPLGGWTKDDDVPLLTRMLQHQKLLKNKVFGDELKVLLSIFPSPMLYAGPREVQWHALSRQNVGATHYIVGRDPAGMKHPGTNDDSYSAWHGQKMLKMNPLFQMTIVPFQFASYDKTVGEMRFFDPKRKDDFISISGTKMRALARAGETPPKGFMDEDGWQVLVDYYQSLTQQKTEL